MVSSTMSFLGIGVCAGMVASLSLLKAWTIRHPPVAFFTQNVGLECGDRLSRTSPACRRPSKKASIAST
ncbi:hypothetical protein PF010_g14936 [Phytophthora fragariae]|uniref:Uncharacterized protein n=1 Tax=Phytophthora fragariae TaxID=53985 RepID=A0A6G0KVF0_9STRA|nr:hypothetical protein PF010_g14936 [Phytophthora fragariae]KAE9355387.1 hypothetical protein PF008_g4080 [Phytophthora fragariae]